ncbi:MAG: hypothetical protein E6R03_09110 [Hyphomicrobiaceae bacterium]|nr:MAG: hypothetical protein E6R03_09110 [Hyphomicrobiaceae bacterium]
MLVEKLGDDYPASGQEIRLKCPQCALRGKTPDTTGHMYVNSHAEKFNCFRCGWKGPLSYLFKVLGVEAVVTLNDWSTVARNMSLFRSSKAQLAVKIMDNTQEIGYPCGIVHPAYSPDAWAYLTSPKADGGRGLSTEQISYYGISVAVEEPYVGRVFIPTFHDSKVVYWVARTFIGQEPKYLNPKGLSKVDFVFGLQQAKSFDTVIVTEGVFSAIAAGPNAVATFGKAVSVSQRQQIADAGFKRIVVALDGDARKESLQLCQWFSSRGHETYLVDLPKDADPDSDSTFQDRVRSCSRFSLESALKYSLTQGNVK